MLADEYDLDHAIAILFIPVTHQSRLSLHQLNQVLLRSGSIPKAALRDLLLLTGLLKEDRHISIVREITDTLRTNHIAGPLRRQETVELMNVEWWTAVIDKGADAIFLRLTLLMVVVVVMVMRDVLSP